MVYNASWNFWSNGEMSKYFNLKYFGDAKWPITDQCTLSQNNFAPWLVITSADVFSGFEVGVEFGLERRGANSARKHEKMTQTIFFHKGGGGTTAAGDPNKHDWT